MLSSNKSPNFLMRFQDHVKWSWRQSAMHIPPGMNMGGCGSTENSQWQSQNLPKPYQLSFSYWQVIGQTQSCSFVGMQRYWSCSGMPCLIRIIRLMMSFVTPGFRIRHRVRSSWDESHMKFQCIALHILIIPLRGDSLSCWMSTLSSKMLHGLATLISLFSGFSRK